MRNNGFDQTHPSISLECGLNPFTLSDMGLVQARAYKSGKWQLYYTYPDPFTGNARRWFIYSIKYQNVWVPINSKQLADQVRAIINKEVDDRKHNPWQYQKSFGNALSFNVQVEKYFEYLTERVKRGLIKPDHFNKSKRLFDEVFKPYFDNMDVTHVTAVQTDELTRKLPTSWKPKTLKNAFDILKAFFNRLEYLNIIHKSPAFPDLGKMPKPAIEWINEQSQDEILSGIPSRYRSIYQVMAAHGLRPGEARALQKGDVAFGGEYGSITIKRAFSDDTLFETPKDKEARVVPINPKARELLESIISRVVGNSTFLFIDPDTGKPYTRRKVYTQWTKAAKKAGYDIDNYRGVRTSYISQMAQDGKAIQAVSAAAGHSTLEMTQHYFKMVSEPTGKLLYGKDNLHKLRRKKTD